MLDIPQQLKDFEICSKIETRSYSILLFHNLYFIFKMI